MPGDDAPSLRERNKARARAEIAAAALRLFGERGFEGVTVDEIVAAAGVSRRTFFRYFDTKEDALLADYPELHIRLTETLERIVIVDPVTPDDPLAPVRSGLHVLADWYLERSEAVLERSRVIRETLPLAARNLEFLSQWERAITAMLSSRIGCESNTLLARTAAAAMVGAFRAALSQWVRSSGTEDLHALIDQALDLVQPGLDTALQDRATPARPSAGL